MAKKRTPAKKAKKPSYTEETFSEISEIFDNTIEMEDDTQAEQIKKHLSMMKERYNIESKDVVSVYQEKLVKVKPDAKNRYGKALKLTRSHFERSGRASAKPYLAVIIGVQHRMNDMNSRRMEELKEEYKGHENTGTADSVEIELKEYNKVLAQYHKIKTTSESDAIIYIKDTLSGRFVLYDEANENAPDQYIENIHTWDTGSANFNFGLVLKPNPTLTFTAVIIDGGEVKLVDINAKGENALMVIRAAPKHRLVMMKVVENDTAGQKWWVDKSFTILEVEDTYAVLKVKDKLKKAKKMIKYMVDAVPNELQTAVENIDDWQRKISKKLGKKGNNALVLVKGTVSDIFYKENDTATISLTNDSVDLDDLDMWDDDEEDINFRVSINSSLVSEIDFDVDTLLYVWGEVYRGDYYDQETRNYDNTKQADMPTMNAWGFVADPELKNQRVEPTEVSDDDFETVEEQNTEEDDGFVINEE